MPRIPRGTIDGLVVHVLNRGNARSTVFPARSDYGAFLSLLEEGKERFDVELYALALLPNHFHAVLRPSSSRELSELMQWWLTSQVRRHHRIYGGSGHVWQGRFKSFPVQSDEHLLTVLRYVLLNPVRAGLAADPFEWPWTTLAHSGLVDPWPVRPPGSIRSWLADAIPAGEMARLRRCIAKRTPYGTPGWTEQVARDGGLESTLRCPGRPPRVKVFDGKTSLSPF